MPRSQTVWETYDPSQQFALFSPLPKDDIPLRERIPDWTVPDSLGVHRLGMKYEFPDVHVPAFPRGQADTWTTAQRLEAKTFIYCKDRQELADTVSPMGVLYRSSADLL